MGIGENIVGVIGSIIIPIITYYAGKRQGMKQERDRRLYELKNKLVDDYVNMVRTNRNSGVYALTELGLDLLDTDKLIREAIG